MAAPGFSVLAPEGKSPAELDRLIEELRSQAKTESQTGDALKALPGAIDEDNPPPTADEIYAELERKRALEKAIDEHLDAERVEPGVTSGMDVAVDPVDMLVGGGMGAVRGGLAAGGRAALQTGASEALATGAARTAGAAGLPPWLQTVVGLGAGLAPLPGGGRLTQRGVPRVESPPESLARVPDEVLPPETTIPSTVVRRPVSRPEGGLPPVIRQPFMPRSETMLPPPDYASRLPPERGLPTPAPIAVNPEGVAELPQIQPMLPTVKREIERPFFGRPRLVPNDRGAEPPLRPYEPPPVDLYPPDPADQARTIEESFARLPESVAKANDPESARLVKQSYGNLVRSVDSARGNAFNPMLLPDEASYQQFQDLGQKVRDYGPENFPSRGKLSQSEFADRLERQRTADHAQAIASFGPRSNITPARTMIRARMYSATRINPGDRVLTPQGPGTVDSRLQGRTTAQQIRQRMDWDESGRFRGNADNRAEEPRYAQARTSSFAVKLDNGKKDNWSAWNIVRLGEEQKRAGAIPELTPEARAAISKLSPRREATERGFGESRAERDYYARKDAEDAAAQSAPELSDAEDPGDGSASFFDEDLPPPDVVISPSLSAPKSKRPKR